MKFSHPQVGFLDKWTNLDSRAHIFSGLLERERFAGAYTNFIVDILTINEVTSWPLSFSVVWILGSKVEFSIFFATRYSVS